MSGLLALLDDVAALAKVAAASVDDVAAAATKAGAKAAGLIIDDAAVTPKYVTGFSPARELPMIWKITLGSLRNKLVILLPILLLLDAFLPLAVSYLLMLGGLYLCFEGAEKIAHSMGSHAPEADAEGGGTGDPAKLEEAKVAGAIKTDFILSAEIMTIALSVIESPSLWMKIVTLAVVGVFITLLVYGAVALIVKMDDIGLHMAKTGRTRAWRALGEGLLKGMPKFLKLLTVIGTAAMLWVGGNIVLHGLDVTGIWSWPYQTIHHLAADAAVAVGQAQGFVTWAVTAALDFVAGLIIGLILIPIVTKILLPAYGAMRGESKA